MVTRKEPSSTARPSSPGRTFLVRFGVIASVLSLIYAFPYARGGAPSRIFDEYLAAYAHLAMLGIRPFDPSAHVSGAEISGRFSVRIAKDCDAMEIELLVAAALFAFPASFRERAIGLLSGTVLVLVANVARICALYFIGADAPSAFEFAHRDLFPLLLVALGAAFFVAWTRRVSTAFGEPSAG